MVEDATKSLLATLAHIPRSSRSPSPVQVRYDWGLRLPDEDEPSRPLTFEQDVTRTVAQALLDRFESDDDEEEREEGHVDEETHVPEPSVIGQFTKIHSPSRRIHISLVHSR